MLAMLPKEVCDRVSRYLGYEMLQLQVMANGLCLSASIGLYLSPRAEAMHWRTIPRNASGTPRLQVNGEDVLDVPRHHKELQFAQFWAKKITGMLLEQSTDPEVLNTIRRLENAHTIEETDLPHISKALGMKSAAYAYIPDTDSLAFLENFNEKGQLGAMRLVFHGSSEGNPGVGHWNPLLIRYLSDAFHRCCKAVALHSGLLLPPPSPPGRVPQSIINLEEQVKGLTDQVATLTARESVQQAPTRNAHLKGKPIGNGYQEFTANFKETHPAAVRGKKATDVSTMTSDAWQAASVEQKQPFVDEFKAKLERWRAARPQIE